MKLGIPFPINPKSFNPMEMTIQGKKILDSDFSVKPVQPIELLEALGAMDPKDASKAERLKALKNLLNLLIPKT